MELNNTRSTATDWRTTTDVAPSLPVTKKTHPYYRQNQHSSRTSSNLNLTPILREYCKMQSLNNAERGIKSPPLIDDDTSQQEIDPDENIEEESSTSPHLHDAIGPQTSPASINDDDNISADDNIQCAQPRPPRSPNEAPGDDKNIASSDGEVCDSDEGPHHPNDNEILENYQQQCMIIQL